MQRKWGVCRNEKLFIAQIPLTVLYTTSQNHNNLNYDLCSKILNYFLFLFSNKILVINARIHKVLVRIANR